MPRVRRTPFFPSTRSEQPDSRMKALRFLATAALSIALAGCDGGFRLDARIVDSEGRPIPGAEARASSEKSRESFAASSDANGCVSLGGLVTPGKYDFAVTVRAAGYKPLAIKASTVTQNEFRFVLAQEAQAFDSQAQPLQAGSGCHGP